MQIIKQTVQIFSFIFLLTIPLLSQEKEIGLPSTPEEYKKLYKKNILKTRINGVYIPKDLADAHKTLEEIAEPSGLKIFKSGEEEMVATKLRLGLGRWIEINWNFYEGSRLSHHLKKQGLLHPEDMSTYIIRTFHRKLMEKELNKEDLIEHLTNERRKKVREELLGPGAVIEPPKK